MLKIEPIPTRKDKIKQPELSKQDVIPRLNSSVLFIGHSGSGKTTLLANLMTRKDMYKKAFDEVFLISPTAKTDDVQGFLELDDDHIIDDLSEAPERLKDLMEEQNEEIQTQGAHRARLICIIFDDVIANNELMKTPEFTKCFIACRHYNFTTMICSQSFKGVPRKCRLQANNIFFFRGSNSEMEAILEDRSPPGMSKKTGLSMIEFATKEPYSFLHINMRASFEERYRKNLDEIIHYQVEDQTPPGLQEVDSKLELKDSSNEMKNRRKHSGSSYSSSYLTTQNRKGKTPLQSGLTKKNLSSTRRSIKDIK